MASTTQIGTALRLDVADVKTRLKSGESMTILDVRTDPAWQSSDQKIKGAIRVSPDQFRINANWPKDRLTVTYCT